jgi:hypothetical protein
MRRRRHDRTLLSQCARGTIDSSRGMRALRLSGSLLKLKPVWSSGLGKEMGAAPRGLGMLYGAGGGGDAGGCVFVDGETRQVVVVVEVALAIIRSLSSLGLRAGRRGWATCRTSCAWWRPRKKKKGGEQGDCGELRCRCCCCEDRGPRVSQLSRGGAMAMEAGAAERNYT